MPEEKNVAKVTNVNYLNRDFNALKSSLIGYAKTYFPSTYKDFNETSPGMMLIEMSAYVGDVLNFYVDNSFREMLIPLAEERRNLINVAKTLGYKAKPITPAFTIITATQEVDAITTNPNNVIPDYSSCVTIKDGMQIASSLNSDIKFETLDVLDFKISGSGTNSPIVSEIDSDTGLASKFKLERSARAISGETKTRSFTIGAPEKFYKLNLPETNVIEIIKVQDSNGNDWYEVPFLAQDKVPVETHYSEDDGRTTGYDITGLQNTTSDDRTFEVPVPYSLEYLKTAKRFVVEVNDNNTTTLMFGNGILRSGQSLEQAYLSVEQVGVNTPSNLSATFNEAINPRLADAAGTLGEAPSQTVLTITYRIGGGIKSNVPSNDLSTINSSTTLPAGESLSSVTITNKIPATGGSEADTIEEIRAKTLAQFSTQNRCVTQEDYEARVLSLPPKFGNIAKVYCQKIQSLSGTAVLEANAILNKLRMIIPQLTFQMGIASGGGTDYTSVDLSSIVEPLDLDGSGIVSANDVADWVEKINRVEATMNSSDHTVPTLNLFVMSYDDKKQLVSTPTLIKNNIKNYLSEYRLLTDNLTILDGFIINFGVVFDVLAFPEYDKTTIKIQCIEAIKNYFTNDATQFKQTIYTNNVVNLLSQIEGVKAVNYVTLTQSNDYNGLSGQQGYPASFSPALYNTIISNNMNDNEGQIINGNNPGYGYFYDFSKFYGPNAIAGNGVILPSADPSVFELKNPNENIKGVVR